MRTLILLALLAMMPQLANAAQRLALIIGNDIYDEVVSLDKARSDATAMSATLTNLGFETITALDANRREMNRAIANFTTRLSPGDTALVFFAGHGIEIDGENYLLPTDIVAPGQASEDFVKFESIALSDLLYRVQSTGARTTLMFLDACRDNPFAQTDSDRSIGGTRGLARITAPEGTFVVFSAGARQQALDRLHAQDTDKNSVFTRLLLPKLTRPGLELRQIISELRIEVRDLAKTRQHNQFPAYYDELLGEFYFANAAATVPTDAPKTPPKPLSADIQRDIHEDFRLTKSVNTPTAYRAFLSRYADYPDALPVTLAKQLLDSLQAKANDTQNSELALANPAPSAEDPARALVLATPTQVPTPQTPAPISARETIRQSQELLNGHGCNAGSADGIIGRRTRAAFARFLDKAGSNLPPSSLGTKEALIELRTKVVVVCTKPVVVAAPPPKKDPAPKIKAKLEVTTAEPKPVSTPKPAAPKKSFGTSLVGRWNAHTKGCAEVLKIRANMKLISTGKYRFMSQVVGQPSYYSASGTAHVSGSNIRGKLSSRLGTLGEWTGTIANNGKSFKVTERSGCTYTFSR